MAIADDAIVKVLPIETDDKADYNIQIRVELLIISELWEKTPFETSIDIWCGSTGQKHLIPLHVRTVGSKGDIKGKD